MKKVFMIAPYFPPRRRVGSIRPFRFARYLRDFGYEPHVVFIEDGSAQLSEREKQALAKVNLIPLKPPFDNTAASGSSIQQPGSGKSGIKTTGGFVDRLFPMDSWWPLMALKLRSVAKKVEEIRPDVIWSTGDPWSSHWLAMKLAGKFDLPWVADFRDPWTLCNIRGQGKFGWVHSWESKIEKRMLKSAAHIVFTAGETTRKYREHYRDLPVPMSTVYNSFDTVFFTDYTDVIRKQDEGLFYLYFFGKFRQLSPVAPVIEILRHIYEADPSVGASIRIVMNGPLEAGDQKDVESAGFTQNFEQEAPVLYEQSRAYLKQADALLLSTSPVRDDIIPAKLWDYLAANRPVLAISSNPEVHKLVESATGKPAFSPEKPEEAASELMRMVEAKITGKPLKISEDNTEKLDKFSSRSTTAQLAGILNEVISDYTPKNG